MQSYLDIPKLSNIEILHFILYIKRQALKTAIVNRNVNRNI